jgi:hypothetical protein
MHYPAAQIHQAFLFILLNLGPIGPFDKLRMLHGLVPCKWGCPGPGAMTKTVRSLKLLLSRKMQYAPAT